MLVFRRNKKKVNEEGEQQNSGNNSNTNNSNASQEVSTQTQQKSIQLNTQIAEILNKKMALKTQYQNDVKNLDNQIIQLQKQKAELGEDVDVDCIEEKANVRFSKKLFEAVTNKTDEMFAAIKMAFDESENISFIPNDTRCRTFAKNIIAFLNKVSWYGKDHTDDFVDHIMTMLNNSQISLSSKEKKEFSDNLVKNLKENPVFTWIFGTNN